MSSGIYGEDDLVEEPGASAFFVGRQDELALLQAWSNSRDPRPLAITGPAGIGKTSLARKFAHDESVRGRRVVWIAMPEVGDDGTFHRLVDKLGPDSEDGLLVVDDVEDVESLRRAIFYSGGHQVLFTTRDPSLGEFGQVLPLEGLSKRESEHLLNALMPEVRGMEAHTLADALEGSPLAMYLASGFAKDPRALKALLASLADLQQEGAVLGGEWPNSRQIARAGRSLYEEAMRLLKEGEYSSAITTLRAAWASLAGSLGPEHPDSIAAKSELGRTLAESGDVAEATAILDEVVSANERTIGRKAHATLRSKANYAEALRRSGDTSGAYDLLRSVLADMASELGDHHPDVLSTQANLAVVARETGSPATALSLQESVVKRAMETYGSNHPFVLIARSNLAAMLGDIGRFEESVEVQQSVVEDSLRMLGREHPDTLVSIHNLASTLSTMGKVEEALPLEAEMYAVSKRTLGLRDHRTLGALNNLLFTLLSLQRQPEALALLRDLLADRSSWKEYDANALATFCAALTTWAESAIEATQFEVANEVLQGVLKLSADWRREFLPSFSERILELQGQVRAKSWPDRSSTPMELKLTLDRLAEIVAGRRGQG